MANNCDKCPFYHVMGKFCDRTVNTCEGFEKKRFEFRKCMIYRNGVKSA